MKRKISIITPCFNEEENVRVCYESVKALFGNELRAYECEHIFCDNASTDRTPDILREIAASDFDVKVIINARNFGPARSTYNGILSATGDAILLFLPADLQDPPSLLPNFVAQWEEGYEVVYGIRATREEGWIMRSIRHTYYRIINRLSYVQVPPDVGDFQLIDRKVLAAMREIKDSYPFIRYMPFECGFKSVGVPYHWQKRKHGISKNRIAHLVDQGLNGIITFSNVPLRLALFIGIVVSVLSIIYSFVTTLITLLVHGTISAPGIPTLIASLFFFAGVQLFFIGLLGEYILQIYGQVRARPLVTERERINFEKRKE